jgi:copper(I)-binding protein
MTRVSASSIRRGAAILALGLAAFGASAHEYTAGDLTIYHPWARKTVAGQLSGGAFVVRIQNNGKTADRLIGASTPDAERVEIHQMSMVGNVMKMHSIDGLEIPAGGSVSLAPSQYHLMLFGLKHPLNPGQMLPMTLVFEHAGQVKVDAKVEAFMPGETMRPASGAASGAGMPMH